MAEYGYAYRSFSTYSTGTVRNETREPVFMKPFVPSVPKSKGNNSSEGHVTRKTIVPVTSRPYDDSATEKYPSRGDDDDQWHHQTSPVRGSPHKVDHEFEANRPQRFSPVANSTGWRHIPHEPTPYSTGAEGRKPIGTTNHDGGYNGTNGYGSDYYGRKPVGSTIRNDNHDGYNNNGTNGYGRDYGGNKERAKPVASTIRNGYNNGTNGYGGDYGGNKEGRKQPIGSSTIRKNDNHDGYNNGTNNYNGYGGDKLGGRNKKDNYDHHEYDGTTNGYSDDDDDDHNNNNNKKEGYKPTSLPIRNNDGYNNNGYGIGNGNNKEQRRPFGSTTRNNNNNNREGQNKSTRGTEPPKISSAWTKAPRKGTQLSEPTHDIEKALELLKMEAAKREQSNANEYEYDSPPSTTPLANSWAAPAPGNGSRFADLITSKFDKATGSPHSPSGPASPNKGGNYGSETTDHDSRKGPMRTFANFNLSARPRTPIIDSREAEEKFNGTRVW